MNYVEMVLLNVLISGNLKDVKWKYFSVKDMVVLRHPGFISNLVLPMLFNYLFVVSVLFNIFGKEDKLNV